MTTTAPLSNPDPNAPPASQYSSQLPTITPPGSTGGGSTGSGTGAPNSALDLLKQTLTDWGLQSLLSNAQSYLNQGYDSNTINLALQNTPEWKTRFAGNELRKAKGLSVLSPAQYIAMEEGYRNVMQAYGLPSSFYDSHDDYNQWIGNDISVNELQSRVQAAHDTYLAAPQAMKDTWQSYFGLNPGDAIAGILDPTAATQTILDRATQVQIGATAAMNGFTVDQARAQQFQQHGTTLAQAQKAYQQIAQNAPTDQLIGQRAGIQFGQQQEENDLLLGDGTASAQRANMYSREQDLFAGKSAQNASSFGVSQSY